MLSLLPSSARLPPKRKKYLKEKWRLGRHRADVDEGRAGKRQAKSMSKRGGSKVGGECFFFPSESSDVRLACCPQCTAEKSI